MSFSKGKTTRARSVIWLIDSTKESFGASKLPSRRDVLQVLFHHHNHAKMALTDSINETTKKLLDVWERSRIPTKAANHVGEHIRKLHKEWQRLKKNINRKSERDVANQEAFKASLDDLFDVAHQDAMKIITIEEDRHFLQAQREKGRRGTMVGVDRKLYNKEQRVLKRKAAASTYEKRMKSQCAATVSSTPSHNEDPQQSSSKSSDECDCDFVIPPSSRSNVSSDSTKSGSGKLSMVSMHIAAALDRTNASDRRAAHILTAVASTNKDGGAVSNLAKSYSSVRRARMKCRQLLAKEIKDAFSPNVPLVLHWDGKIMEDLSVSSSRNKKVERLPILVSGLDVVKLLAVPKLPNGTAASIKQAILTTVDDWNLRDRIKGLCFDTTASNTGSKGGACVLLEAEFGRDLLNLPCRHHMSEIVLQHVFSISDISKSDNIELFGHFRDYWPNIIKDNFSTALDDPTTSAVIAPWRDSVIKFAVSHLQTLQPRDDYRELLQLTIIFLGGNDPCGISFRKPGAIHRARWMSRAIYSIKMWLFRNQYPPKKSARRSQGATCLHDEVWEHLKKVSLFVSSVYVKYWFTCTTAAAAPRNDLELFKSLTNYPDKDVANAAITAFKRHLWYCSEILVGLSFFDEQISADEKRNMVVALRNNQGSQNPPKRFTPVDNLSSKCLHDFVTTTTAKFFTILNIPCQFLDLDPANWSQEDEYQQSAKIVNSLKVVNDLAERGVALIQEFNSSITRDEEQKQYLLQMVEQHRKHCNISSKTAVEKHSEADHNDAAE